MNFDSYGFVIGLNLTRNNKFISFQILLNAVGFLKSNLFPCIKSNLVPQCLLEYCLNYYEYNYINDVNYVLSILLSRFLQ